MKDPIEQEMDIKESSNLTRSPAEAGFAEARGSTAPVQCGDKFNAVKVEVNNLIMMYAPETMTIKEADQIACDVVVMITLGKYPVR